MLKNKKAYKELREIAFQQIEEEKMMIKAIQNTCDHDWNDPVCEIFEGMLVFRNECPKCGKVEYSQQLVLRRKTRFR